MPSRIRLRLVPCVLALALVLAPVSFATATPWSFDAPSAQSAQTATDGGFFAWVAGWFADLLDGSDSASAQVDGASNLGAEAPQPTDGLSSDEEEKDLGPAINVEGNK